MLGEAGSWASGKGLMGTRISVFPFLLLKGGTWFWHFHSNIFLWILCSALLLSYQKSLFSAGAYSSQEGFPSLRLPPPKKALIEIVFKIDGDTGGTLTLFHPTCIFGGKLVVKCFSTSLPWSQPTFGGRFSSELPALLNPVSGLFRRWDIHNYNWRGSTESKTSRATSHCTGLSWKKKKKSPVSCMQSVMFGPIVESGGSPFGH